MKFWMNSNVDYPIKLAKRIFIYPWYSPLKFIFSLVQHQFKMDKLSKQQSSRIELDEESRIIATCKNRIEQEQIHVRNEMNEKAKKNLDLVTKQREFLRGMKKDKSSSVDLDERRLDTNRNESDQTNRNLKASATFDQCSIDVQQQQTDGKEDDGVNRNSIRLNTKSSTIDLHKSKSMNSRKLLQSIINRNLLTKINLPNLKLSDSNEDLNEESRRIQADKRTDQDSPVVEQTRRLSRNDSIDDLIDDSSKDSSKASSISNSRESLDSRNKTKRNGKRKSKRNDISNENEKENLEDNLTCSSEPTELVNEREKRRTVGYPGLAFGSSIFSSNTMMRFRLISNELHNIQNVALKRVMKRTSCVVYC